MRDETGWSEPGPGHRVGSETESSSSCHIPLSFFVEYCMKCSVFNIKLQEHTKKAKVKVFSIVKQGLTQYNQLMKKRTAIIVAAVILVSSATYVFARYGYYQLLTNTYKNIRGSRIDYCLCHLDKDGGGPRNPFGVDYANHNHNLKEIENRDSDNDGFTNIDEINNFTNPGDNADYPKDKTPPTITITVPKMGDKLTGQKLIVKGTVHDDRLVGKIIVKLTGFDERNIASKNDVWETEYLLKKNGNYDLTAKAIDSSGNESLEAHVPFSVLIPDNEPPSIQFFFPAENMVLNSLPIIVTGIASDVTDVTRVECSLDDKKTWLPADGFSEWKYTIATIPEGETSFWARAIDSLGNVSQPAALHFRLEFDQVATPIISYPFEGLETESDSLTISGTLAPPAVKIGVVFDGAPETWAQIDGSFWSLDVGSINPGKHTVVACAYDQLNRKSETCAQVEFSYVVHDVTPPVIKVSSPKDNSEMELGDLVITGTATDDYSGIEKIEATIDGKNWLTTTDSRFSFTFPMKDPGSYQIFIRATDKAGNFNGLPVIINVTVLPKPAMTVTDPDQTSLATGDFRVIVTLSRKSMPEPKIELAGNTKDFTMTKVKELTWRVDAKLGAGNTKVTISSAGFTKNRRYNLQSDHRIHNWQKQDDCQRS